MSFILGFDETQLTVTKIDPSFEGELIFPEKYLDIYPIKVIGYNASYLSNTITKIDLSQTKVERIEEMAFYHHFKLQEVILPDTLTFIGVNAFRYSALKSFTIPPKLGTLDGAFNMNRELETFIMNNNNPNFAVEKEGIYSSDHKVFFRACASISFDQIQFLSTIESLGKYAFSNTKLEKFTATSKINSFYEGTFERCSELYEIDLILSEAKTIPFYCFKDCNNLKVVVLPSKVERIRKQAFFACQISALFHPSSIQLVDDYSFGAQTKPTRIYYFGTKNIQTDAFMNSVDPIIYVPTEYQYETFLLKSVIKTHLNEMFVLTKWKLTNICIKHYLPTSYFASLFFLIK